MRHLTIFLFTFLALSSWSQEPIVISLSLNKTVHLFFPTDIIYTDIGSKDALFEAKNYILKLAAGSENFPETNLTIITKDNFCYSFLLRYTSDIKTLNYFLAQYQGKKLSVESSSLVKDSVTVDSVTTLKKKSNTNLDILCQKALKAPFSFYEGSYHKKIFLSINNIFIAQEQLFFVLSVGNESNINYDVDFLSLSVSDKKRLKKSSVQDINKTPVYSFRLPDKIVANTKTQSFVLVYDKFTIPDNKKLIFEMREKNGGRDINYSISKDLILSAISL